MVLIFSAHSNQSEQVLREVQLASNSHLHIVQFRIQDVIPNDDLEYYLSAPHWLDALLPPLENHLERLKGSVKALLQMDGVEATVSTAAPSETRSQVPVAPKVEERPAPLQRDAIPPKSPQQNLWMPALVGAAVLCAILFAIIFLPQSKRPKGEAQSQPPATPAATIAESPIARSQPSQSYPTAPAKGPPLFSHNFETASPIIRPLFGANIMSVLMPAAKDRSPENHRASCLPCSTGFCLTISLSNAGCGRTMFRPERVTVLFFAPLMSVMAVSQDTTP